MSHVPHVIRCYFIATEGMCLALWAEHSNSLLLLFSSCAAWPISLADMIWMSRYWRRVREKEVRRISILINVNVFNLIGKLTFSVLFVWSIHITGQQPSWLRANIRTEHLLSMMRICKCASSWQWNKNRCGDDDIFCRDESIIWILL